MRNLLKTLIALAVLAGATILGAWLARRGGAPQSSQVADAADARALPSPDDPENLSDTPWRYEFAPVEQLAPVSSRMRETPSPSTKPHAPETAAVTGTGTDGSTTGESARPPRDEHPLFALLRAGDSQPIPQEVADLAAKVTAEATNDLQKARAIYDWITDNIQYDTDEWLYVVGGGEGYSHEHDPVSVLERGTTVCIGYSWLFDAMARSVGLDATYLIGDTRGYRGTPEDDAASGFKHAWNAVAVDGGWTLLDATWGSRQVGENADDYRERRDYYFGTPADQMIFDHLPESQEWQLLDNPVASEEDFRALPNLKPAFFESGMKIGATISDTVGPAEPVVLWAPDGVALAATVSAPNGKTRQIPVMLSTEGLAVVQPGDAAKPGAILRVYAKRPDSSAYECAVDFVVAE